MSRRRASKADNYFRKKSSVGFGVGGRQRQRAYCDALAICRCPLWDFRRSSWSPNPGMIERQRIAGIETRSGPCWNETSDGPCEYRYRQHASPRFCWSALQRRYGGGHGDVTSRLRYVHHDVLSKLGEHLSLSDRICHGGAAEMAPWASGTESRLEI